MIPLSDAFTRCIETVLRIGGVALAVGVGLGYAGRTDRGVWLQHCAVRLSVALIGTAIALGAGHLVRMAGSWLAAR